MEVSQFMEAIEELALEKGMPKEAVLKAVEAALAAAYRKDYGRPSQTFRVKIDPEANVLKVFNVKKVVENVKDPLNQISLEEAKKIDPEAEIGGEICIEMPPPKEFGRIAAQTAKQVIIQRLKETERELIYEEFKAKEKTLVTGTVQQFEGKNVIIDLGKASGILPPSEQIPNEKYKIGERLKVFITSVERTPKGPQILLSRTDPEIIRALFEIEVPEIEIGSVEIKAIAREAGSRTKMAVASRQEGVDPVGSCVGQRGTRVNAVLSELGEEKIDIILWDKDPEVFIVNALSPAKVAEIEIDEKKKEAKCYVTPDQLSLAIGKEGQNVRLAAKLTGWKIDIIQATDELLEKIRKEKEEKEKKGEEEKSLKEILEVSDSTIKALKEAGYKNLEDLQKVSIDDLTKIKGIGKKTAEKIIEKLKAKN